MSTVYENIAKLCEERGISLYKLSTDSNVGYDTLKALRDGTRTTVSIVIACRLAGYFECSANLFLDSDSKVEESCFGVRLRLRRVSKNITLEKLAEIINVTPSVISNLETGKITNINPEHLINIAEALGTTPHDLIGWREGMPEREADARIIHQLSYLNDADIELLESIVSTMRNKKN